MKEAANQSSRHRRPRKPANLGRSHRNPRGRNSGRIGTVGAALVEAYSAKNNRAKDGINRVAAASFTLDNCLRLVRPFEGHELYPAACNSIRSTFWEHGGPAAYRKAKEIAEAFEEVHLRAVAAKS